MIKKWLTHPATRNLDVDSIETTLLRRRIIQEKPFLKKLYTEWYQSLLGSIPLTKGILLELGSGAGFLKDLDPTVITSEVFACEGVDRQIDACLRLPFEDETLKAIVMTDVFHHLPNVDAFFRESTRTVRQGGIISMIEPWVTAWSRLIYTKLHHEPFDPQSEKWSFPSTGPLSGANGALPWIVFNRDKCLFEERYPEWEIITISPMMPVAYLLSGGVSLRSLAPGWSYGTIRAIENGLCFLNTKGAMFAHIVLRKKRDS